MKYRVKLTSAERNELKRKVSQGTAPAREIMHAHVLLKVDVGAEDRLTDKEAARALRISSRTVQRVRETASRHGVDAALGRKAQPPRPKKRKLGEVVEVSIIAVACSDPPEGRSRWTLRLLSERLVELEAVSSSISHESIRQVLKKTNFDLTKSKDG
jgi:hypothetical protein